MNKHQHDTPEPMTGHDHDHHGHHEHGHDHHAAAERHDPAAHVMAEADEKAVHGRDIKGHAHHAHADHSGHEEMFRRRFWVSLLLSIPVILYSHMIQQWLGFTMPAFPGSQWLVPGLSIIVFLYGGVPFLQMAVPEIRTRQPGMMTLISLAITVAFVYSLVTVISPIGEDFFWELVSLITIMLLGHWLEMRSVRQASGALDELAKLMPDTAERIGADGQVEEVPVHQLKSGDRLLIRPGASVPADGEVVEGRSDVNEAMITGESLPVKKEPGSQVIGGTINEGDGSLRVRVTATGEATALAGIMRLVEQAQQSKSRTQLLADKAAGWLFYAALAVAALTAVVWTSVLGFNVETVKRVVTVLVIACPHALGLAIPLVVAITTRLAAQNGILVRDRLALEAVRLTDTVIFDKTGTLTKGEQGVVSLTTVDGWAEARALALAAAVEGDSEHFIAQAIRRAASESASGEYIDRRGAEEQRSRGAEETRTPANPHTRKPANTQTRKPADTPTVTDFEALKGRGVKAMHDGRAVYAGGPRLLELLNVSRPAAIEQFAQAAGARGQGVVYLVDEEEVVAVFALADVIRPESRAAVDRLHEMGIEVAMLTGDNEAVARAVAAELGIDHVFAEVLPEHKDQKVAELQAQGKRVVMVGDGVNDAPALTRADVGIAIGSGTDVAVESAGIILVQSNPLDVVKVIRLSRASYRKMMENLVWATGYNIVALPLAAGVLAPVGILLSPAVGAVLMSLSTIIVAINAQLLRRAT
jgi:P-type Cu2+ transporter